MAKEMQIDFNRLVTKTFSYMGKLLVKRARDNMNKISYGRVYVINGKRHIASKWGDSPNNLTKALYKTLRYEVSGREMVFGAGNAKVKYAKFLEKPLNRPNIVKSVLQERKKIEIQASRLLEKGIKIVN